MQHRLKASTRATGAGIVASEFFDKLLVAVDDAVAAFHVGLGREAPTPLTGALESRGVPEGR